MEVIKGTEKLVFQEANRKFWQREKEGIELDLRKHRAF